RLQKPAWTGPTPLRVGKNFDKPEVAEHTEEPVPAGRRPSAEREGSGPRSPAAGRRSVRAFCSFSACRLPRIPAVMAQAALSHLACDRDPAIRRSHAGVGVGALCPRPVARKVNLALG